MRILPFKSANERARLEVDMYEVKVIDSQNQLVLTLPHRGANPAVTIRLADEQAADLGYTCVWASFPKAMPVESFLKSC